MRAVRHAELVRPTIGYVDAVIFSDSTARELRGSVDSLRARGMRTLILDLRNDPGGLLAQGVAVADLFLDSGQTVVSMRGRSPGVTRDYTDDARQAWPGLGVILLVNRGTASASEIVAGALQDHDRALILGAPSYGKGSAQTLFHVDDAALKLTTALWYTPSGRSINRRHPRDGADDGSDDDAADSTDSPHATRRRSVTGSTRTRGASCTAVVALRRTSWSATRRRRSAMRRCSARLAPSGRCSVMR